MAARAAAYATPPSSPSEAHRLESCVHDGEKKPPLAPLPPAPTMSASMSTTPRPGSRSWSS